MTNAGGWPIPLALGVSLACLLVAAGAFTQLDWELRRLARLRRMKRRGGWL